MKINNKSRTKSGTFKATEKGDLTTHGEEMDDKDMNLKEEICCVSKLYEIRLNGQRAFR